MALYGPDSGWGVGGAGSLLRRRRPKSLMSGVSPIEGTIGQMAQSGRWLAPPSTMALSTQSGVLPIEGTINQPGGGFGGPRTDAYKRGTPTSWWGENKEDVAAILGDIAKMDLDSDTPQMASGASVGNAAIGDMQFGDVRYSPLTLANMPGAPTYEDEERRRKRYGYV